MKSASIGEVKDFNSMMNKFDKERKSAEKILKTKFHEEIDEQHSYIELDRTLLKERAA